MAIGRGAGDWRSSVAVVPRLARLSDLARSAMHRRLSRNQQRMSQGSPTTARATVVALGPSDDSGNLDVIRSMAVLLVVISHIQGVWGLLEGRSYHVGSLGLLGVITFFVHTCLVLMMSLERQTAKLGTKSRAVTFFIRRAFRIYPLSIVVVGITHFFASSFGYAAPSLRVTISNLLLVQNIVQEGSMPDPLWSLPYEVQMYLVLPVLFVLMGRWGVRAPRWIFAAWVLAILLVLGLSRVGANYHLVKYIPCFLPGVLAYSLRATKRTWPAWVLFASLGVLVVALPMIVARGARENIVAWPICLALGLLIPRCREARIGWLRDASKVVAKYSYGIYLVHVPAIALTDVTFGAANPIVRWGVCVGGATVAIWLAYHAVEKPGIDLGNRLAKRWQRTRAHA